MKEIVKNVKSSTNFWNKYEINDTTDVIYNNSDPTKYYQPPNISYKVYNSGIYYNASTGGVYTMYLFTEQTTIKLTTKDGIVDSIGWGNAGSGGAYGGTVGHYADIVDAMFYYSCWPNDTTVTSEVGIPIFTDYNEYFRYVTNPYLPSGGGSGSGYIGNNELRYKKMVGYNVPTSSTASTKTESVEVYSNDHEDDKPKAGNGFARIKMLQPTVSVFLKDIVKTTNKDYYKYVYDYTGNMNSLSSLSEFYLTDWILVVGNDRYNYLQYFDGNEGYGKDKTARTNCTICLPITSQKVRGVKYEYRFDSHQNVNNDVFGLGLLKINSDNSLTYKQIDYNNGHDIYSYTTMEHIFDSSFDSDYLCISVCDSLYHFKNIELYVNR